MAVLEKGYLPGTHYHSHLPPCFLKVSIVAHEIKSGDWFCDPFTSFSRTSHPACVYVAWISRKVWLSLGARWDKVEAGRIVGSMEAVGGFSWLWDKCMKGGTEMAGGFAHSFPDTRGNHDRSFLAHFPWFPPHSCLELFLLHSLEPFHGVPTVNSIQSSQTLAYT